MEENLTGRLFIRLTPEGKRKLQDAADSVGMTMSDFTRMLLVMASGAVLNASQDKETFNKKLVDEFNMIARRLTHMFYAEEVTKEMEDLG